MDSPEPFVEIRTSPDRADEFIDRLISDQEFRDRLESEEAAAALAEYDISVTPELLAEQVGLPAPEEIEKARSALDAGELTPETVRFQEGVYKFWPIFLWPLKFRKFRAPAA